MHGVSSEERSDTVHDVPSYQDGLRKLGAWLDAASARAVVIRESRLGFIVRYDRQDIEGVFIQRFFTYPELRSLRRGDWRFRRTLVRRIGHKLQGVAGEPGGYQDLFRALGHTLDEAPASHVHISEDEVEGKLVITYHHAPHGSVRDTVVMVLGPDEREAVRKAARSRRVERGIPARRR